MTRKTHGKNQRILAIALSAGGFGFAVLEGKGTLVDWGTRSVRKDKNAGCLGKVETMIAHYEPAVVVLHDTSAKGSWHSSRIRRLTNKLITLADSHEVSVELFTREQVKKAFFDDGKGTKHTIARLLSMRFPDELGHRLPPKRKPWVSEDSRMDIFDAVALAVTHRMQKRK